MPRSTVVSTDRHVAFSRPSDTASSFTENGRSIMYGMGVAHVSYRVRASPKTLDSTLSMFWNTAELPLPFFLPSGPPCFLPGLGESIGTTGASPYSNPNLKGSSLRSARGMSPEFRVHESRGIPTSLLTVLAAHKAVHGRNLSLSSALLACHVGGTNRQAPLYGPPSEPVHTFIIIQVAVIPCASEKSCQLANTNISPSCLTNKWSRGTQVL